LQISLGPALPSVGGKHGLCSVVLSAGASLLLSKDDDHGGRYDYRRQPTAQHIIEKDGQRFIDDLVKPRSTAVRDLADPSGMVAKQTKDMTYDIA
jgi:hypothetical protein